MSEQCKGSVWERVSPLSRRGRPCQVPAKRDGWCGIHHPDAVAKKRAAREARWAAENATRSAARNRQISNEHKAIDHDRVSALAAKYRDALERIANAERYWHFTALDRGVWDCYGMAQAIDGEWISVTYADIAREALAEEAS